MFGAGHRFRATACLLAQLAFATVARGSDVPNTVVVTTNTSDARMTRALVLIRGELSALGLELQVRATDTADAASSAAETSNERLSLDVKDGAVVVRVFTSSAPTPLVESVELDGPEVSAEVIAVRAVEALRAAHLLPAQAPRTTTPKPPPTPPPAEQPPPSPPPSAPSPATPTTSEVPLLQLELGPTLVQNSQGLPQLSAHAALRLGPHWGFAALGAESSISGPEFAGKAGSAHVSRRTLGLQLGARLRVHRAWELNARGGVSYIHYAASGVAQPGYLEQDLAHDTGAASLSFGGAYYFVRAVGVYLDLSALVAFDAAHVRLGNESAVTLDRPSLALGVGVLLGAF